MVAIIYTASCGCSEKITMTGDTGTPIAVGMHLVRLRVVLQNVTQVRLRVEVWYHMSTVRERCRYMNHIKRSPSNCAEFHLEDSSVIRA